MLLTEGIKEDKNCKNYRKGHIDREKDDIDGSKMVYRNNHIS